MDSYHVYLSPKAKVMLEAHIDFLSQVSTEAAVHMKEEFLKALHSLEMIPLRYPVLVSEYIKYGKYRKMLVEKRYLVIYQVKENTVYVDAIVDCRTNYHWLLK